MIFEHGIGGSKDLPIPSELAIAAGVAALTISFIVLILAWRTPRFDAASKGDPVPAPIASVLDGAALAWAARLLGLAFASYVGWAAVAGQDLITNPFFGVVYVWLWVGIVPASLVFGPFYRAVNPVRTLHLLLSRATGLDPSQGLFRLPGWVGLWPATGGLFAFVWMELVYPRSTYLVDLRLWFALYLAIVFIGAAIFGDRWISSADPFEVFSTLVGRLCLIGRTADGTLVVRNSLGSLDGTPPSPGLTGVVSVLFGSTAFDSFKDSPRWVGIVQDTSLPHEVINTAGLLGFCLVVLLTFAGATMFTGVHQGFRRYRLPDLFAHSVVPIIVGYFIAHYLSYFVYVGQQTLIYLSNPLGHSPPDDFLGTSNLTVNQWILLHPTFLAVVKVLAVVVGHIYGVVAAHDRAIKLLPKRHQLTGQLPLLFVMVFYTGAGLFLLLSA